MERDQEDSEAAATEPVAEELPPYAAIVTEAKKQSLQHDIGAEESLLGSVSLTLAAEQKPDAAQQSAEEARDENRETPDQEPEVLVVELEVCFH
jgi:hypothetical protein